VHLRWLQTVEGASASALRCVSPPVYFRGGLTVFPSPITSHHFSRPQAFCNGHVPEGEGWPRYELITENLIELLASYIWYTSSL
jgi:hypothetical protein